MTSEEKKARLMLPIKTYSVTVDGFSPVRFCARTPGKARAQAYRSYCNYDDRTTFKRFLEISRIFRVNNDDCGHGERRMINGRAMTRVIDGDGRDGIKIMPDGSDEILRCHHIEWAAAPAAP